MRIILIFVLAFVATRVSAQDVTRTWKTIDDETGKPRSVVLLVERDGKVYGTITEIFEQPGEEQDPICELCPGDRKNKKIIGMEIIRDMKYDKSDSEYVDGEILDPESGSIYDCKIWVDEESGNLKVRGYVMFMYRTQTWLPYEN